MQQITNGTINFNIDIKEAIQQLLCDPQARQEILAGLKAGPKKAEKPVGFANLGAQGQADFFSLFLSTNQNAQAGLPGYFYRNQAGNRIGMRLRRQPPKQQVAVQPQQLSAQTVQQAFQGGPDTLSKAMQGDAQSAQELLALVQQSQQGQPAPQPQPQPQLPNNFQEALSGDAPAQPAVPSPFDS